MPPRLLQLALRILDAFARLLPGGRKAAAHLVTGRRGEEAAYFHLRREGYTIVARNFRSRRRRGEIDLVGWDGDTLCFIEVKTRTTLDVKPPEAAVDREKQRELAAMAREYVRRALPVRAASKLEVCAGESPATTPGHGTGAPSSPARALRLHPGQAPPARAGDPGSLVSILEQRETRNEKPSLPPPIRFDIVSVYCENQGNPPQITLFKNAFPVT